MREIIGGMALREASIRNDGVDIYGGSRQLSGTELGGDNVYFMDFGEKYDLGYRSTVAARAARSEQEQYIAKEIKKLKENQAIGILLTDVSGHDMTDAALAGMLRSAFMTAVRYELRLNGKVTTDLFTGLNSDFYDMLGGSSKHATAIYGEVSKTGRMRYISAGHLPPAVFSREFGKLMDIGSERRSTAFTPIGVMPSDMLSGYGFHDIQLMGREDVALMYTDGLYEHMRPRSRPAPSKTHKGTKVAEDLEDFFPHYLERSLRDAEGSAKSIYKKVMEDLFKFGKPRDDVSLVVIKREK